MIAEVYALHIALVCADAAAPLALGETSRRHAPPGAVLRASMRLGFGNHLSMILLAPAFTLFLLIDARRAAGDRWSRRA